MKHAFSSLFGRSCAVLSLLALVSLGSVRADDEAKSIFNGKDLTGWKGLDFWSVKDGAIVGQSTPEHPIPFNTFLVYQGSQPGDFELTCKFRISTQNDKKFSNSGIQYRSKLVGNPDDCVLSGYQADMEVGKNYTGMLYEEKARGILCKRGEKVVIKEGEDPKKPKAPKIEVVGSLGTAEELLAFIDQDGWNEYKIIAKGNHLQHFINGHQTVDVIDETKEGAKAGLIGLQMHKGGAMTVEFKELMLKELK
jgi:hypothetical protein